MTSQPIEQPSTATSAGFIGDYALQLVGAAIGAALVVTGMVKYFRR
jgi:hypothetical protein